MQYQTLKTVFDGVVVHRLPKNKMGPISSHLTECNKGFMIWLSGNVSHWTLRVIPIGQDSSILPSWVANHSM